MQSFLAKIALLIGCCFTITVAPAQKKSFNQQFLEANTLMEEKLFHVALPIWIDLLKDQPNNCNL